MKPAFKLNHLWTALALALPLAASAGSVTVVTSFPKELTGIYKAAFEKANPGIKLEILNKNTAQGIAYVRELPVGQRPDIFWASAPDAFAVLAGLNLLSNVTDLANKAVPAKVGNFPINDPQGLFLGQALAGYGLMWNTRYMQANKVPAPKQWADLMKPAYFNHVALSAPSRSGTTHLTVETMLQGEGWEKGWRQLLEISGNAAQIPKPWYNLVQPVRTLTATIAGDMGEADQMTGSAHYHVLFAMGLCLLLFSFACNLSGEWIVARQRKRLRGG